MLCYVSQNIHRIGYIEQNDNGFDLARSFEVGQFFQDITLFRTEGEDVAIAVAGAEPRQVRTFAADAGNDHNSGVAIIGNRVPFGVGKDALRNFINEIAAVIKNVVVQAAGSQLSTVVFSGTGCVEVPDRWIDREPVGFQSIFQVECFGRINGTGTGAAVDEIGTAGSEQADLCTLRQRQSILTVQ